MRRPEHELQAACVKWFRLQYPRLAKLYVSVPNGVPLGRASAIQFWQEGMTSGVADTLLLVPSFIWHGLAIEYKVEIVNYRGGKKETRRTYQTQAQKEWQALVEAQGWRYAVVRSFDEFRALISEYLRADENSN